MQYDVFISYSSADRAWAEVLEQKLLEHMEVFRDKTRLTVAEPFQQQLFDALDKSSALLVVWSRQVRDVENRWKEWVITERERFRLQHPHGPIVYLLLDEDAPHVDAHTHKLDEFRASQARAPSDVKESAWKDLIQKIKAAVLPTRIEVDAYVLACTADEFRTLHGNPNLGSVLSALNLEFSQVVAWYGRRREDWRPAGTRPICDVFSLLERMAADVLQEDGVPEVLRGNPVVINCGLTGLWDPLDPRVQAEIDRLVRLDFVWVFLDPLSLYHPVVQSAANRIAGVRERNRWSNLYIVDPVYGVHDRTCLRAKLQTDFASLYRPLVKPQIQGTLRCLGGVDVWHADDFERVFRETIRLRSEATARAPSRPSPGRAFATMGLLEQ